MAGLSFSLLNKIRLLVLAGPIVKFNLRGMIQVQEYDKIQTKNISQSSNRQIIWPASITISAITALVVWMKLAPGA